MIGTLAILNVGYGDTKLTFDNKDAAETIRAARGGFGRVIDWCAVNRTVHAIVLLDNGRFKDIPLHELTAVMDRDAKKVHKKSLKHNRTRTDEHENKY
jgi:hypothetical protein